EIAAFVDVYATVEPRRAAARAAARYTVTLENRGNGPVRASLGALDPDQALGLAVAPATVDIAHGATATAAVTARPRQRFLWGQSRPRPFRIVADAGGAGPVELDAILDQQPALPRPALAAVVALVAVALAVALLGGGWLRPSAQPDADIAAPVAEDRPDVECIGRDHLASEASGFVRPNVPMPVSYSFLQIGRDGCTPFRFNPCEPIRYVTSGAARPADRADLAEALRRLSAATGIEFVHDGEVADAPPVPPRAIVMSGPEGPRWAPVHIAWVDQQTIGRARPTVPPGVASTSTTVPHIGIPGAGLPIPVGGVYVTGVLLLNVDAVADLRTRAPMPHGFGRGPNWGRVMLHELGHLLGLGHVQSTANLMHHELGAHTSPNANFGIGDQIALDAIGRKGGCVETPVPRLR
ncbi:MAG: hypothetical protein M3179_10985, partial [Actinomycetota bacterium]|nr:hypothetical protein [Actinomycetota bacterium]